VNLNSPLELSSAFRGAYRGKRVLVTGHTGFKGSWLCEWLLQLGADVTGFALSPPTQPALFDQLGLAQRLRHVVGDVRELDAVRAVVNETCPDFIFHLAAQSLVRRSYAEPVETYATNVMGTVNVLEALRSYQDAAVQAGRSSSSTESTGTDTGTGTRNLNSSRPLCAAVMITTDKCYENREWLHGYREEDPLGGYDPYSSSKGAAELVIAAYRRSFFSPSPGGPSPSSASPGSPSSGSAGGAVGLNSSLEPVARVVRLASARAGNVIGGGDWALDRIVPDCMRALKREQAIPVRNRHATRPWQHVLEPLSGYLWLGACLASDLCPPPSALRPLASDLRPLISDLRPPTSSALASAFNFGPQLSSNRSVGDLVQEILKHWPGRWEDQTDPNAVHEAGLLNLSIDKAYHLLGWRPVWDFATSIEQTVRWYRAAAEVDRSDDAVGRVQAFTQKQIECYQADASAQSLPWMMES